MSHLIILTLFFLSFALYSKAQNICDGAINRRVLSFEVDGSIYEPASKIKRLVTKEKSFTKNELKQIKIHRTFASGNIHITLDTNKGSYVFISVNKSSPKDCFGRNCKVEYDGSNYWGIYC